MPFATADGDKAALAAVYYSIAEIALDRAAISARLIVTYRL
jgi:hypothetical protein